MDYAKNFGKSELEMAVEDPYGYASNLASKAKKNIFGGKRYPGVPIV